MGKKQVLFIVQNPDNVVMAVCSNIRKANKAVKIGELTYSENWSIEEASIDSLPDFIYNRVEEATNLLEEFTIEQ